jgi:hypothetical protein
VSGELQGFQLIAEPARVGSQVVLGARQHPPAAFPRGQLGRRQDHPGQGGEGERAGDPLHGIASHGALGEVRDAKHHAAHHHGEFHQGLQATAHLGILVAVPGDGGDDGIDVQECRGRVHRRGLRAQQGGVARRVEGADALVLCDRTHEVNP